MYLMNWSVRKEKDSIRISGNVFNHRTHRNGTLIITPPIEKFEKNKVTTSAGVEYELSIPLSDYEEEVYQTLISKQK